MKVKTPDEVKQREILKHVKGVLGDKYVTIEIQKVNIEENIQRETTQVVCDVRVGDEIIKVDAAGAGVIDAIALDRQKNSRRLHQRRSTLFR